MKTAVYLEFKDQAKQAIEIYQDIFDAQVVCEYIYAEEMTQNPELLGKVFHAELIIGDLNLYLSDSETEPSFDSVKFVIEVPDEEKARSYFEKLIQSGKKIHDFRQLPIGPTIASAEDSLGIRWDVVIC
jgi:PhnB protein